MGVELVITIAIVLAQLVVVFGFLLVERREPTATLAWLLAVVFLPAVGVILYLVIGRTKLTRSRTRLLEVQERVAQVSQCHDRLWCPAPLRGPSDFVDSFLALGARIANLPASPGNACEVLVNASAAYPSIVEAILAARDHIHVEFYIFKDDDVGVRLRDVLAHRARDDIEVRVVVDGVGSMALPRDFWTPLERAGGKVAVFSPVSILRRLRRRDRVDFRNHRKIVVVDGRVGFTGGINIGKEYLGLDPHVGAWRDTHIRIEGPAVLALQHTFAEDWLWAAEELIEDARYYPEPDHAPGDALVQIVDSGPDRRWAPIHRLYVQAIAMAKRRVYITNAYFVPDRVMGEALITAALRDVDVRVLLPRNSDNKLVTLAGRGNFGPLLAAGVRIYEYHTGFVHAKTLLVDDQLGTIGSANMDVRSFRLNFEVNAFVLDARFCQTLAQHFEADLADANEVDAEAWRSLPHWRRVLYTSARLLSPLL